MNCYEHTLIAKQDLSDTQNKKLYEKYENIINKNSGKIIKTEEWGLRNLATKTKNNTKGIYYHIKFEGVGKTIEELERAENIDEGIIRFLTVKVKKHDLETNYFEKKDYYDKKEAPRTTDKQ
ncbi:MAG: small subunit ribosomal protein S6 [Pelagibacterales bacterium]|nr:small subunit ribosomal protein S6 [Pelagibacterales bacterium]